MARKPDIPCTGGCGKMLWRGTGSLPSDQMKCRDCRASAPRVPCVVCGGLVTSSRTEHVRCHPARTSVQCEVCGGEFPYRRSKRFCSARCRTAERDARVGPRIRHTSEAATRRRARKMGVASERYTRAEIAERDGYCCGLCGGVVDMGVAWPHRESPSVDHVVPLVRGGNDTRANCQLAHLGCNLAKGARVEVSA